MQVCDKCLAIWTNPTSVKVACPNCGFAGDVKALETQASNVGTVPPTPTPDPPSPKPWTPSKSTQTSTYKSLFDTGNRGALSSTSQRLINLPVIPSSTSYENLDQKLWHIDRWKGSFLDLFERKVKREIIDAIFRGYRIGRCYDQYSRRIAHVQEREIQKCVEVELNRHFQSSDVRLEQGVRKTIHAAGGQRPGQYPKRFELHDIGRSPEYDIVIYAQDKPLCVIELKRFSALGQNDSTRLIEDIHRCVESLAISKKDHSLELGIAAFDIVSAEPGVITRKISFMSDKISELCARNEQLKKLTYKIKYNGFQQVNMMTSGVLRTLHWGIAQIVVERRRPT